MKEIAGRIVVPPLRVGMEGKSTEEETVWDRRPHYVRGRMGGMGLGWLVADVNKMCFHFEEE